MEIPVGTAEDGAKFIQLQDCPHVFEVTALDRHMEVHTATSTSMSCALLFADMHAVLSAHLPFQTVHGRICVWATP